MLKNKALLIISIIFFLLLNTRYYWEGMLGAWAMLEVIVLVLTFIILSIALIYQIFLAIKEKLTVKSRVILIVIMLVTLVTVAIKPCGFVAFEKFEKKDVFIAERGGVAGCMTILKLKVNNKFYIKSVCFGVEKQEGTYSINKDTITFKYPSLRNSNDAFKFGVIRLQSDHTDKEIGELDLYKSIKDSGPIRLFIRKNDLIK